MEKNDDLDRAILLWCNENLPNGKRTNTDVEINGFTKNAVLSSIENLVKNGYINIGEDRIKEMGNEYGGYYLVSLSEKGREYLEND